MRILFRNYESEEICEYTRPFDTSMTRNGFNKRIARLYSSIHPDWNRDLCLPSLPKQEITIEATFRLRLF